MPPETLLLVKDWGFPAVLCLYLLWRIDRTFVPGFVRHLDSTKDMAAGVKANVEIAKDILTTLKEGVRDGRGDHEDLAGLGKDTHTAAHEAREEAKRAADGVVRIESRIDSLILEKRVPSAPASIPSEEVA